VQSLTGVVANVAVRQRRRSPRPADPLRANDVADRSEITPHRPRCGTIAHALANLSKAFRSYAGAPGINFCAPNPVQGHHQHVAGTMSSTSSSMCSGCAGIDNHGRLASVVAISAGCDSGVRTLLDVPNQLAAASRRPDEIVGISIIKWQSKGLWEIVLRSEATTGGPIVRSEQVPPYIEMDGTVRRLRWQAALRSRADRNCRENRRCKFDNVALPLLIIRGSGGRSPTRFPEGEPL